MKNALSIFTLCIAVTSLTACAGLKKNSEAMALAATQTNEHRYNQSMEDIEEKLNNQLMTMSMIGRGMGQATDMEIKSPLERKLNLKRLRYQGQLIKLSQTKIQNKAYNLLEQNPRFIKFIGKQVTRPKGDTFAVYTIKDHGSYRTIKIQTIENMVVKRLSEDAVNISIMGIGVNYKDFYDVDESLKKAYVDEKEQYAVLRRVDSKTADNLYNDARAKVEGKEFESRVN